MKIDIDKFEKRFDDFYYDDKKLKVRKNTQGYCYVYINKKNLRLHRLVALRYIPNPNNYPIIDHIDGDKTNNSIINLDWISYSDNSKKAYSDNDSMKNMHEKKYKLIIAIDKNGVEYEFKSLRECAKYLSRDVAAVYRCLKGEWSKCNNHILKYR